MKFGCCSGSEIEKLLEIGNTYLNCDKNTDDAHHNILREHTCDVGILIIVHIK